MSRSCAVAVVVIVVPRQFGTALTGGEPAAVTVIVRGGNEIAGRAPRLRFVAKISHGPALIVISVVVVRCCDTWDSELPAAAAAVIIVVVMVGVVGSSEEPNGVPLDVVTLVILAQSLPVVDPAGATRGRLPVVAAALVVVIVVVVMVGVAGSSEELNSGESEKTGLRHVDGVPAIAAAAVPVVKPSSSSGGIRKGNNNLEIAMQSPHDATQKVHASTAHLAHTFTDLEWAKL
ncbi:hypothetical protein H4582DRAFT_2057480 [Lactarius indigo]|nr:hypothetical protein H4582DRAFT_2057480 [Lactarius indigo]